MGLAQPAPTRTKLQMVQDLLSDGEWHFMMEIKAIGGISYTSRIGELRTKMGLTVIKRRDYTAPCGWMYRLVTDPNDPAIRVKQSPKERLLDLLRDGRWHSNEELFEIFSSSYQDHLYFLRREGLTIFKMKDPDTNVWCYRLEDAKWNFKNNRSSESLKRTKPTA